MAAALSATVAEGADFERNLGKWMFSRDSISWSEVSVPHDWAIAGPFDKKWDLQNVAITQNGETEKSEKSGRSGALPWIGRGYYTTSLDVPDMRGRSFLVFDGAMADAHVSVNGRPAVHWPYGYNAFRVEITGLVHPGANTLAVSLNNREESSRWYPGAGLYRPVTYIFRESPSVIDPWDVFVMTESADSASATVVMTARVDSFCQGQSVRFSLVAPSGGQAVEPVAAAVDEHGEATVTMKVAAPKLWSPETPWLYKATIEAISPDGQVLDSYTLRTGLRTVRFTPEHGFQLNGHSRKFRGVCLHHDLGPLGAAVNRAAIVRQALQLKEMGCDAIRTSHNMPSQMQMEVYDSLGLMVMAESFDTWLYPKVRNGYSRYFREWAARDIATLVRANRNHPSLVMYSIGNEIPEQWSGQGRLIARQLQGLCHSLDPTRYVTQGMDRVDNALRSGFAREMDVPGWNYRVNKYDYAIRRLTQGFQLGSETASTVSSRGVYKFPDKVKAMATYPDGQCSGYDTEYCSWSNLPDVDFMIQEDRANTLGQFVWTGYDYLGEPTPYDEYWPSRSSYFGIIDLAGLPKDRYWLYRSVWAPDKPTVHLLPHWTWPGREGQPTPVYCYTNCPEAELFVNGKSQGRRRKTRYTVSDASLTASPAVVDSLLDRYRLRWRHVRYEPGELRVVVYDSLGLVAGEQTVRTAGRPARLSLQADRTVLHADGRDLSYITVSMTDSRGTLCPDASDEVTVEVSGQGTFRGICNGDATSLEEFTRPRMHLFHGQLVVTVQAGDKKGKIRVRVRSGNKTATAEITTY